MKPNSCNDTHDCSLRTGDNWLRAWVGRITSSASYRSGSTVLFVTWDEGDGGDTLDCARNGCHIVTLVVSRQTPRGKRSGTLYNHYSLLKTTERLLGLRLLGHAADSKTASMRSAFGLS